MHCKDGSFSRKETWIPGPIFKKSKTRSVHWHACKAQSSTIRDVWAQHTRTMQSYSVDCTKEVVCLTQMVSAQDRSDWAMIEEHPYPNPPSNTGHHLEVVSSGYFWVNWCPWLKLCYQPVLTHHSGVLGRSAGLFAKCDRGPRRTRDGLRPQLLTREEFTCNSKGGNHQNPKRTVPSSS
jgi:hypothetical protein